jgi:hypothetical protein
MSHETRVLFILKRRQDYNGDKHSHIGMSTGLYNSASFMNDMLNKHGIHSKIAVVRDNNDIDREVTLHKPKYVIIEALWVVPSKFSVLCKLHPNVKWIIRLHSEIPFLANEGIAMDWLGDYPAFHNVIIAANAPRALKDLRFYIKTKYKWTDDKVERKVIYLPNYYPDTYKRKVFDHTKTHIDIGCFGAIRPMKNHLTQAIAAIKFAEAIGKKLRFHINAGRVEQKGDSVLNNLRALFTQLHGTGHELINHGWMPREEFLEVCGKMDIGMQVSLSETFNIVAADLMSQGVPVIGSNEIPWMFKFFTAKPTDTESIFKKLRVTHCFSDINVSINQRLLHIYTNKTSKIWKAYFKK